MVSTSEFRPGNLVYDNENTVRKISSTGEARMLFSIDDCVGNLLGHKAEECNYIPLTVSRLLDFGYYTETTGKGTEGESVPFYTNESSLTLDYNNFSPTWKGIELDLPYKLEFVHQLQNLYHAMTGEELTVKEPTL